MQDSQQSIKDFNQTIDQWIDQLDHYTLEELIKKPISNSWSIGQVYMHLTIDTPWHIEQMKTALTTNDFANEEMHDNAKWMFAHHQFPDIQIENPANDSISQPSSKEDILHKLLNIRKDVNDLYNSSDFTNSVGKVRHPGLLFFSALEWLQFTEMHLRHHFRQKKRIDDALENN